LTRVIDQGTLDVTLKVMISDIARIYIRTGLILIIILIPGFLFSQTLKGRILSSKTDSGIGYVNIAIAGKNIGTVSDEAGNFKIKLERFDKNDSLKFSMVGFRSLTVQVNHLLDDSTHTLFLDPILYNLNEIRVIYRKPRIVKIGTEVTSGIGSGFGFNFPGSEFGIKLYVKQPLRLIDLNLNVSKCTFDTVTYRLNIYQSSDKQDYNNILTQPIYITFTKDQIDKPLKFNLEKYSLRVEGNIIVALELYKDLGDGKLFFFTGSFADSTYHRRTLEGSWIEAGGIIGMYLRGRLIR
jgi:hypothetical protein